MTNLSTTDSDAFATRLLQSSLGMFEVLSVYLGDRLGLYRALADRAALTSTELAKKTGCAERYVREWLEQQAVSGLVAVEDASLDPLSRHYSLPPAHAEVLTDRESLNYMAPIARLLVSLVGPLPDLIDAFRRDGGVSWARFGVDAREGQAEINRPVFLKLLCRDWLKAAPEIDARLRAAPAARVADIGCGAGWSSIAIAVHYPLIRVDGFDLDDASVELARQNLEGTGVEDRLQFHLRDAADPLLAGRYDLVTAFEMVHDLSRPVDVLRTMRRLLAPGGSVLIIDERVAESFYAPGDDIERLMYGWSVFCCLATAKADPPAAETGTVMRPATLRRYALEAGFSEVETIEIDHAFFRMYRLLP